MTVIDLSAELERRERYAIALADGLREMLANAAPEDPEPTPVAIIEIIAELKSAPPDDLEFHYRCAVAFFMTKPGGVVHTDADPAPNHRSCLAWARAFLDRVEGDYGVRLLDFGGRRA